LGRALRLLLAASVVAVVVLLPAMAGASIEGGCTGSAVIDGVTYGPDNDTSSNPIIVPIDESGVVADWQGSVTFANTNHHGSLGLVVGPWTIEIAHWSAANEADERSSEGMYNLDDFKAEFPVPESLIPRGLYELSGVHDADGGHCEGHVMVKLDGAPLSSPVGVASVAGTVVTGLALLGAGFRGRM
jgi:hypothetical protein